MVSAPWACQQVIPNMEQWTEGGWASDGWYWEDDGEQFGEYWSELLPLLEGLNWITTSPAECSQMLISDHAHPGSRTPRRTF